MNYSHLRGNGPAIRQAMSMLPVLAPLIPRDGAPLFVKALLWILARPLAAKILIAGLLAYMVAAIFLSVVFAWYIGPLMLIGLFAFFGIGIAIIANYFRKMMAGLGNPMGMFAAKDMDNMFDLAQDDVIEGEILAQPEIKTVDQQDVEDRRARAAKYIDPPKKQQMLGPEDSEV